MSDAYPSRKKAIRQLVEDVRRILLDQWDPLGVGGMPQLSDEYDFVLGHVMSALAGPVTLEGIVDTLSELERDYLCLPTPTPDQSAGAARSLLTLKLANEPWPNNSSAD